MTARQVREWYGVDYKRGDRLVWRADESGKCDLHGTLVSFPGSYLGVRFDGDKGTTRVHPTWRITREASEDGPAESS